MKSQFIELVESVNEDLLLENSIKDELKIILSEKDDTDYSQFSEPDDEKTQQIKEKGEVAKIADELLTSTSFSQAVMNVFSKNPKLVPYLLSYATKLKDRQHKNTFGKLLYLLFAYQQNKRSVWQFVTGQDSYIGKLENSKDADIRAGVRVAKNQLGIKDKK